MSPTLQADSLPSEPAGKPTNMHTVGKKKMDMIKSLKNSNRNSRKIKKQRNIFQTKEQEKSSETNINKIDMSNLPNREFKSTVINMLNKVRSSNSEHENFTREKSRNRNCSAEAHH